MSLDLVSLGLAAAMPVIVFLLYLGLRSVRQRGSIRRADARSAESRRSRPLPGRSEVMTGGAIAPPAITPSASPAVSGSVLAKLPSVRPMDDLRARPRSEMTLAAAASPAPVPGAGSQAVVTASLAARPYQVRSTPPSPEPSTRPKGTSPGEDAHSDRVSGPSRIALTLNPLRTMLVRGSPERRASEPQWPDRELVDPSIRIAAYFAEPADACPACDENRARGAKFCRRCGRSFELEAGSAPASSSVAVPSMPPPPAVLAGLANPTTVGERSIAGAVPTTALDAGLVADAWPRSTHDAVRTNVPRPPRASNGMDAAEAPTGPDDAEAPTGPAAPHGPDTADGSHGSDGLAVVPPSPRPRRSRRVEPDQPPTLPTPDIPVEGPADHRIRLNAASATELSGLRGIGRVTAEKIVAARDERAFDSLDELVERKILGPAALAKIRDHVTVGP